MAWKCGCVCHTALTTSSSFTKDCCYCTLQQKTKKAKPANNWIYCDCDWLDTGAPTTKCAGSCESDCRLYRDEVIHWRDGHWHLVCAFRHALRELANRKI